MPRVAQSRQLHRRDDVFLVGKIDQQIEPNEPSTDETLGSLSVAHDFKVDRMGEGDE